MLTSIGVEVSAAGVGLHYGARSHGGVLDGWLVDEVDADQVDRIAAGGAALPRRTADDDRPRRHGRDGGRRGRAGPRMTRIEVTAPDGAPEVQPGDDLVGLICSRWSTSPTATSWS